MIGTNIGHGHAWERPDGLKAKCGGPTTCSACAADQTLVIQQNMTRDDGMPKSKDERRLRRLLGVALMGYSLYTDDGEMSYCGSSDLPAFDFMRESVDNIEKFIDLKNRQSFVL